MNYFVLKQDENYGRNPTIKGWHGKLDLHSLRLKGPNFSQRLMFQVSATENTFYPDMMMNPVLMVSEKMRDAISMYEQKVIYREVFLLDADREEGHVYYIPFLPVVDCLNHQKGLMANKNNIGQEMIDEAKLWNRNIVEAADTNWQCIIVSLDFAESILRREFTGVGLTEIV